MRLDELRLPTEAASLLTTAVGANFDLNLDGGKSMIRIISIIMAACIALVWVVSATNQANAGVHILRKIHHHSSRP
jgi:hypothetical protein